MGIVRSTPPCDGNVLGPPGRVRQRRKSWASAADGPVTAPWAPCNGRPRRVGEVGVGEGRERAGGGATPPGAHALSAWEALRRAWTSERLDAPAGIGALRVAGGGAGRRRRT